MAAWVVKIMVLSPLLPLGFWGECGMKYHHEWGGPESAASQIKWSSTHRAQHLSIAILLDNFYRSRRYLLRMRAILSMSACACDSLLQNIKIQITTSYVTIKLIIILIHDTISVKPWSLFADVVKFPFHSASRATRRAAWSAERRGRRGRRSCWWPGRCCCPTLTSCDMWGVRRTFRTETATLRPQKKAQIMVLQEVWKNYCWDNQPKTSQVALLQGCTTIPMPNLQLHVCVKD